MIFRRIVIPAAAVLALFFVAAGNAAPNGKAIRLRTGAISTPPRADWTADSNLSKDPVSGIFLIQFESEVDAAQRAQLRESGIDLLAYVPDDAFVARLRGVRPTTLARLPFVRWFESFRPEQRLHGNLLGAARGAAGQGPGVKTRVRMLLDAGPDRAEHARVRALLQEVSGESHCRLGIVVTAQIHPQRILEAAASPAVLWIEPEGAPRLADESASALIGGPATNHMTFTQSLGYDGAGVTVAVTDSGLDRGRIVNHTELLGRTAALLYYGDLTSAVDDQMHGTHVAGIIAGTGITVEGDEFGYYGLGVSPGVQLVIQRVFDARGNFHPPIPFRTLAEDLIQYGATIGNNSWADDTQGRYDLSATIYDDFVRDADPVSSGEQPLLFVFAAGNAGPGAQTIGSPAVGKNVIAVGASQGPRTNFFNHGDGPSALAGFSSRGPCEDGRIKPDLVAPGTWIASLLSRSGRVENAWAPINDEFAFAGGTSQAAPHVTGAAAIFVQFYRSNFAGATPSPALIKAALINTATDLNGVALGAPVPNMDEGWGRANVAELVRSRRKHEYIEQSTPLATSETYERLVFVTDTNLPLKLTLVYTDYPGFPAAIPALVNNLDLELEGPDGRTYYGNQFAQGESIPNARARDTINNVEGILLAKPIRGVYRLRVFAKKVSQDTRLDTAAVDQDFALVISGGMPVGGEGVILANRTAYRAPDRIDITLRDGDLAGQSTASVIVKSKTEPNGVPVVLRPAGGSGTFTGAVETASGPVNTGDSRLQVAHQDWIRLEYFDASYQTTRVTMAMADLMPPVLSSIGVTNQFGQYIAFWTTDELATSFVRYGTIPDELTQIVSNETLTISHTIEFTGLVPGQTYYFQAGSTDAAGNVATSINSAASFVPTVKAIALLVDAYEADPLDTPIPIDTYTVPLTELGITHDVWSWNELQALPTLADLRRYSIVIWRINDSFRRPNDAIPLPQQQAIRAYLDAGGSFFLASMNVLSRLLNQGSGAFVTNVLQVQRFVLNPSPLEPCASCDEDFQVANARGVDDDPIGQGIGFALDYANYSSDGILGPDFSDTFTPSTNASPVLVEFNSGKPCGLRFPRTGQDSPGRVVFLSIPLDAIPATGFSPNTRRDVLQRAIRFLAPGVGGVGTLALNQHRFSVPDLVTIEMADSDLEGSSGAIARIHSDSHPTPVNVLLNETTRPGVFRGFASLLSITAPPIPGGVRAVNGDRIHVRYLDASTGNTLEALAVVDAIPPEFNPITVRSGYFDATITWTTSEPTDALVQYGESSFLGQTTYRRELRTEHSMRLTGLVPDRTYYFKIAVRDESGNLATADNDTDLYRFETLPPLRPPFIDDIENLARSTNWSVYSHEDSQRSWSIGPPNDGHTARAYSGLNTWASNLYGEPADIIDTSLISPGIDLRPYNVATLKFQHDYDFIRRTDFDLVSRGRLLISTNVQTDPVLLAEYQDFIFDWEQVELDLTPYAGRVIFLIWQHELRSATPEMAIERPGWALDDIQITATNVPGGTLRIASNISQARFSARRGGLLLTGQGSAATFTNLPPGTYVTTFSNIDFYTAPAPVTNILTSVATLNINGVYKFNDINTNGMSDAWELDRFGNVSPARNARTDTDNDGFPDYAEFIAGTNPLIPNSHLALFNPFPIGNELIRFSWPSSPGRSYQLQTTDMVTPWNPASGWIRASGDAASVILPAPDPAKPHFYRVEVRP